MMRSSLAIALFLDSAAGLSDAELALFSTRSCSVTYGAQNGDTLTASVAVTKDTSGAGTIRIVTNGVPDHATCDPDTTSVGSTCYNDPITTYFYDQTVDTTVPLSPAAAAATTGLPAGTIGYARNGVALFSAYSRPCTDAVVDEAIGVDACQGHPQEQGAYHYHVAPSCLEGYLDAWSAQQEYFIGVALDGFPVYSMYDANGALVTNAQLDECHGYDPGTGYRYIANLEFPYMIGCFTGTPLVNVDAHCSSVVDEAAAKSGGRRLSSIVARNASLRAARAPVSPRAEATVRAGRQLQDLCASTNNSACSGSACGFPCDSDCGLWGVASGDDSPAARLLPRAWAMALPAAGALLLLFVGA